MIKTLNELLERYDSKIQDVSLEYKEPGYNLPDGKIAIVTANWNDFTSDQINEIEEHFEIEWLDEWTCCQECNGILRTNPDCYQWQSAYIILNDCELLCLDCIEDYIEEYYESLENNPKNAVKDTINQRYPLIQYGYTLIEENFENGLHQHMNDNPEEIYTRLHDKYNRLIFLVDDVSQFYITFSVYAKIESD